MYRYVDDKGYPNIPGILKLNTGVDISYQPRNKLIEDDALTIYAITWANANNIDRYKLLHNIRTNNNDLIEVKDDAV